MMSNGTWPHNAAQAAAGRWPAARPLDGMELAQLRAMLHGDDPTVAAAQYIDQQHRARYTDSVARAAVETERTINQTRNTKAVRALREGLALLGVDLASLADDDSSDGGEVADAADGCGIPN